MPELHLRSLEQDRAVNLALLGRIARTLLEELLGLPEYELSVCLLPAEQMAAINRTFLAHSGVTDVITFDYATNAGPFVPPRPKLRRRSSANRRPTAPPPSHPLHGEVLLCLDEACAQARRFRTSWQRELIRYLTHGVLHLLGYEDSTAVARRRMKRVEDHLVQELTIRFTLSALAQRHRVGM